MIVSGSTINARRAGSTLAIPTAPTNTSGAASHTHTVNEPAFGVIRATEPFEEEFRGDHEQTADRHLRNNQTRAEPAHRLRRPHALPLKHGCGIIMANLEERHETRYDRDAGARCARGSDASEIRGEHKVLGVLLEEQRRDRVRRPHGEQHAEGAASQRDDDAVRDQLFGELAAAGTERHANGCLVRTARRP